MRKFLLIAGLIITCFWGNAQSTIIIGSGPALTANYQSGPIYRSSSTSSYDYSQYAYLYTAAELSAISSGTNITGIAWNKTNAGATTAGARFKIYLKNSSVTGYTTATAFSTLITGATLVYDNSATTLPATTGFQQFNFSTAFTYNGGSLEVMVDWDVSAVSGNPTTLDFSWQRTTEESRILGYANSVPIIAALSPTSNSIGDITNSRPVTQFSYGPPATPCSGTPEGGLIISPDSICTSINFTLSVSGASSGVSGLTYQWQSSADSTTWNNIGSASSETLNVSQTANTFYRRIIFCAANSDTSTAKVTRIKSAYNCYCQPATSDCTLADLISNVSFGTLNNSSTCSANGYIDYTASVAAPDLVQASSANLSVTVGSGGLEYVAAWIDFNHNGIFETSEYTSLGSGTGVTLVSTISIPDNIPSGLTRMRMRVRYNAGIAASDNCLAFTYGETEDYAVNILAAIPCSGTPTGGTTLANVALTCPSDSIVLSVNGATTGVSGLTYQWQSSVDNSVWQDIAGSVNATVFVYQNVPTYYRRKISCGSADALSASVQVGMTATNLCYCRPDSSNCSVTADITNVHFAALNNSSTCSFHGYGNYINSIPATSAQAGLTIPISISSYSVSSSLTNYFIVWIDYNHDGVFDSSEHTFLGTVQGTGGISGTIKIPVTALTGVTGMRVRAKFNSPAITGFDACTSFGTSETEDYLVNILPPSSCSNGLSAGVISGPFDVCSGFPVKLSVVNASVDPTVRYAWQSSPDSLVWSNINNTIVLLDSVITSQFATTYYRLVDSCSTANSISNAIKVNVRSGSLNCHCVPPGSSVCTIGDIIGRVRFGTIDTTTYCSPNGYGNFVNGNQTTTINANSDVSIMVQIGCATLAGQSVVAWIDFNQDGIFEPSEYTYIGTGCGTTVTKNISIPTNALAGQARLRVRETGDAVISSGDACTQYANGETEDYKVTIVPYSCPLNTWTGAASNAWENPLNWSCGEVPGLHSNVLINSGTPVISSNVTIYSIDVNSLASLTVNPGFNLTITH